MNRGKKILLGLVVVAVLVAIAVAYVVLSRQTTTTPSADLVSPTSQQSSPQQSNPTQNTQPTSQEPGRYIAYSEEAVKKATGKKILFFHAPWCPQCRALDASIEESAIPSGVTIFKVDYDSNQALRAKYGVTLQTTLVEIDDRGDKIKSFVAYEDPSFATLEREFLN